MLASCLTPFSLEEKVSGEARRMRVAGGGRCLEPAGAKLTTGRFAHPHPALPHLPPEGEGVAGPYFFFGI